jgi:hypothetical protein
MDIAEIPGSTDALVLSPHGAWVIHPAGLVVEPPLSEEYGEYGL